MRPSAWQYLVFFLIAGGLLFGLHYYLWARLVRDPAWPSPWRLVFTIAIALFGLLSLLALPLARILPFQLAKGIAYAGYTWMGLTWLLLVFAAAGDVVKLALFVASAVTGRELVDEGRRLFLARSLAGVASGGAGLLGAVALRNAGEVAVLEVPVRLARLPRELDGLTLAMVSDVHVGETIGRDFAQHVAEKAAALRPDAFVIVGDLVDGSVAGLREKVEPLAGVKSRYGTYFVSGNHEYYSGVEEWFAELHRLGIRVLHNERVTLGDGKAIDLAGVDDWSANAPGHGPRLADALSGRDPERELVLLAHQPKQIAEAARLGVGLQLSGHTHGGQIAPFGAIVGLTQPFMRGLHRQGDAQIYVSCGTGYWGPPMRLGAPAELTKIVLHT